MNKTEKIKLERVLIAYFKEIHKIYTGGDFREESFYSSLEIGTATIIIHELSC